MADPQTAFHYDQGRYCCQGAWLASDIQRFPEQLTLPADLTAQQTIVFDGSGLTALDSAGAWQLLTWAKQLKNAGYAIAFDRFSAQANELFSLLKTSSHTLNDYRHQRENSRSASHKIGRSVVSSLLETYNYFTFVGQVTLAMLHVLARPWRFKLKDFVYELRESGSRALGIIALLSFLIGIVLAYQMGVQLRDYGADIFIVDLTGIAIVREFGPLMSAIILAGRTSSAFTAQLGMMKFNSEIDALTTMGIDPIEHLILPKMLALLVAVPLLVYWADLFGVLGSMVMAKGMFHVSYVAFILRFRAKVSFANFAVGLIKAPFFALIIGSIGCFQGMHTRATAASIGRQTTKSVVQAIFIIIMADAGFSVLFSVLGF